MNWNGPEGRMASPCGAPRGLGLWPALGRDLPHFSENPEGVLAALWERVTKRNPTRHDIGA